MGMLVDGQWRDEGYDTEKSGGRFERSDAVFRQWVTMDGASGFKAEPGRYHLYIAYVCPWAHRTLIWRALKGLEDLISVSVTAVGMGQQGWHFDRSQGSSGDSILGAEYLHQIYTAASPDYTGRVTVPTLWDRERRTIVSNESADIVRMFNTAFNACGANDLDLYPESLRAQIDAVNERVYRTVNNGVYRCGFATSQQAYDEAFDELFASLDWLEQRLAGQRYLVGGQLTEADWRLFPTLMRFDLAYHGNFKCNARMLKDYPNLWAYARELYQYPGIADTVNIDHIKRGYYSIERVNPAGIVPKGPVIDFTASHDRARLPAAA
ncbi:MAG: glutathione S-transferase family protein [Pseudomonadota bacterium]|nr:glutathione S-transferase family protein [Pseudomonadota bacterium]